MNIYDYVVVLKHNDGSMEYLSHEREFYWSKYLSGACRYVNIKSIQDSEEVRAFLNITKRTMDNNTNLVAIPLVLGNTEFKV